MTALIDTSVLIGAHGVEQADPWSVSVVSVGELEAGVLGATDPTVRAPRAATGRGRAGPGPLAPGAASGRLPSNDLWIAATALAHDLTLVTANARQAALPLVRSTLVA